MAEYVYIQNYNKKGTMGISHLVFDQIAEIATNEVAGATVSQRKKSLYSLFKPVQCTIRNGMVTVKISVKVNPRTNVKEVAREVQENVATQLNLMTELIPFNISVEVIDVG
ncbi:MAG: Asp23/Gls24 family envelope stress response protein [Bacilli bacterium]|nr:Asp23/Gls24 family envelope stress response protein [Bacilli bacterium]